VSNVWLITGSASGLGYSIAKAALEAGNRVVATARSPEQLDKLAIDHGDRILVTKVDVTSEAECKAAVALANSRFGRIDVVVNNAGYGDTRPFEEVPSDDFRLLVETCFFGVVNMTREALPIMRRQRSGHIVQISSVGGRFATAGNAAYHAAKWAVGGFTEAVAAETASFGVKLTALEPGGMRTNWGKRAFGNRPAFSADYEPSVGENVRQLASYWGNEMSDPDKVAAVVLKVAEADVLPAHILLGSDALQAARSADEVRAAAANLWEAVSAWTDVRSQGPLPALPPR
jgi:NAD(P)-dependent dehydrogenase (short-subunit alcohol dehydrogenase family)